MDVNDFCDYFQVVKCDHEFQTNAHKTRNAFSAFIYI